MLSIAIVVWDGRHRDDGDLDLVDVLDGLDPGPSGLESPIGVRDRSRGTEQRSKVLAVVGEGTLGALACLHPPERGPRAADRDRQGVAHASSTGRKREQAPALLVERRVRRSLDLRAFRGCLEARAAVQVLRGIVVRGHVVGGHHGREDVP